MRAIKVNLSPMMQQYRNIKKDYADYLLFYRLGDFYELFFDDAILGAKELDITLTKRDCGDHERAPMCGVPYHSVDGYISKLINKGYKIAICEQTSDTQNSVGIVNREVVQVITPGTVTNTQLLDEKSNNFLCSIYQDLDYYGLSFVDITTGDLFATRVKNSEDKRELVNEISRYTPSEIIINNVRNFGLIDTLKKLFKCRIEVLGSSNYYPSEMISNLKTHFEVENIQDLGMYDDNSCTFSINAILKYLKSTQFQIPKHINKVNYYEQNRFMDLDFSTKKDLELVSTIRENKKNGSLLWVLDKTKTSMGARLLKNWFEKPLTNIKEIHARLSSVNEFIINPKISDSILEMLSSVKDIERLSMKLSSSASNPREIYSLGQSITSIPGIIESLKELDSILIRQLLPDIDPLLDIKSLIERSISEDAPISISEGNIIKEGFDESIDDYKKAMKDGKIWISTVEEQERKRTGIKNLKIGFNKVFGYYFEVSKSNLSLVPDNYTRKQTLANCERFINVKLKTLESMVLSANEKACRKEHEVFCHIRDKISKSYLRIYKTAKSLATLDVLINFAKIAVANDYIMPEICQDKIIKIENGRHPVVEAIQGDGSFVPNDLFLDEEKHISIITGPNMSGKSTYMRQSALIVLMAQIGCFVPATRAKIGIVDKIFTRIGAWDDLSAGQSTFMVEMREVSNILDNATKNSFLVLDEIGRGTSTHDGLSIAWAVLEYISNKSKLGAKALFATHYHELTRLADKIPSITNYSVATTENNGEIVFLRKIIPGCTNNSYGIEVAKLAGIKNEVIARAKEISKGLGNSNITITIT